MNKPYSLAILQLPQQLLVIHLSAGGEAPPLYLDHDKVNGFRAGLLHLYMKKISELCQNVILQLWVVGSVYAYCTITF
jgi:hypothetical protein